MHLHLLDTLAAHRAERAEHRHLVEELSAYTSESDRLEIETIVARYSEEETREVRAILDSLAA
jgi:hypothetical protein